MVFDAHSDIWADVTIRSLQGERNIVANHHLERLKKGQIEGSIFAVWADPPYDKTPFERTLQIWNAIEAETADWKEDGRIALVHNYEQMQQAIKNNQFYVFTGLEGLSSIGEDIDLIDQYYEKGARTAMLTWNEENKLATGIAGTESRGLTMAGKKAVERLISKNMILDVSHLNERSFWEVTEIAKAPIIASHSNAKALSSAARNLTDEQLIRMRDLDGVIGMNSFNIFVSQDIALQNADTLVKHMSYIADKIGVEHVGMGFDFFEFMPDDSFSSFSPQQTPYMEDLADCSRVPYLLERMEKAGFTKKEIVAIAHENFHRVIKTVLK